MSADFNRLSLKNAKEYTFNFTNTVPLRSYKIWKKYKEMYASVLFERTLFGFATKNLARTRFIVARSLLVSAFVTVLYKFYSGICALSCSVFLFAIQTPFQITMFLALFCQSIRDNEENWEQWEANTSTPMKYRDPTIWYYLFIARQLDVIDPLWNIVNTHRNKGKF